MYHNWKRFLLHLCQRVQISPRAFFLTHLLPFFVACTTLKLSFEDEFKYHRLWYCLIFFFSFQLNKRKILKLNVPVLNEVSERVIFSMGNIATYIFYIGNLESEFAYLTSKARCLFPFQNPYFLFTALLKTRHLFFYH